VDWRSPVPLRERIEAVAAVGFTGFGVLAVDLAERDHGLSRIRTMLADNGIAHLELERLPDWWSGGPERTGSDGLRRFLLTAAQALGALLLKVTPDTIGALWEPGHWAAEFALQAADAGARLGICGHRHSLSGVMGPNSKRRRTEGTVRAVELAPAPHRTARPRVPDMRAVQITRFGGPEVLDVVDLSDPVPGESQQLYEVPAAGINYADTHHPPWRKRYMTPVSRATAARRPTCGGSSHPSESFISGPVVGSPWSGPG
jgi:hypothetical protein